MILSIFFCSVLFGLCVYIFSCELIVCDPMPFNNCNFRFISHKKKEKKSYVDEKEKKEVNVMLPKQKQKK